MGLVVGFKLLTASADTFGDMLGGEGFYRAMGGEEVGRTASAVEEGRTLPRMRLAL